MRYKYMPSEMEARMKFVFIVLLLLWPHSAFAEPKPWMKQINPNNLGLFVGVSSECPFQQADIANRIEGEFLRARLKPTKSLIFNLTVYIRCMPVENNGGRLMGHVVSYEIRYGSQMPNGEDVLYESPNHGSMLIGSTDAESNQYFIDKIKDSVSMSLTDYLKANFQ